jgi:SAM-dependent methyltransferase
VNVTRSIARTLAHGPLLSKGKRLFEQNSKDWNCLSSKSDKLQAGLYLILEDYSKGLFPPKFEDQAKAYAAEINYRNHIPGQTVETVNRGELRKPFWFGRPAEKYFNSFIRLTKLLAQINVHPPARLLELGCGTGWMAEFLAIMDFDVTGTSISPTDIKDARARLDGVVAKGMNVKLRFEVAPMEAVDEMVGPRNYYDAVFVYEALHHAFDWRQAIQSSFECLRPGGWLLICREPNVLHTFISYRVAKLSNSHEIGFQRGALTGHLRKVGFSTVKYLSTPFHFWVKNHWIIAQKPSKGLSTPVSMHIKAPEILPKKQSAEIPEPEKDQAMAQQINS